jgi:hypothetical protein
LKLKKDQEIDDIINYAERYVDYHPDGIKPLDPDMLLAELGRTMAFLTRNPVSLLADNHLE